MGMTETETQTTDIGAEVLSKDGRLKIPLRKSAKRFLAKKAALERVNGRKLTHDEAMELMLGFVEVENSDAVAVLVTTTLKQLARDLDDNGEDLASDAVDLFRECLIDVVRGRTPSRRLTEALENVN